MGRCPSQAWKTHSLDLLLPVAPRGQSRRLGLYLAHLTHPPSAVLYSLVQPSVPQPRGGKEPCEGKTGSCLAGPVCDLPLAQDQGWATG